MRITTAVAVLFVGLLGFASSSSGAEAPKLDIQLRQASMPGDVFYFRGPVNLQYQLAVTNPTSEPITLRRIDLSTMGSGAYSLHTGATPITRTIPPNGKVTIDLSAWGQSAGGFLRSEEPVTVRGVAYLDSPGHKSFVKQFTETFMP
ncbi:MAG TPA: hypothetical protein VGQ65_05750 [Thermoanaerobaculia bacterium]|jgi:hypothetical protein|nr:hypothetical protein [Thermoanaerobaculia bacterium]